MRSSSSKRSQVLQVNFTSRSYCRMYVLMTSNHKPPCRATRRREHISELPELQPDLAPAPDDGVSETDGHSPATEKVGSAITLCNHSKIRACLSSTTVPDAEIDRQTFNKCEANDAAFAALLSPVNLTTSSKCSWLARSRWHLA